MRRIFHSTIRIGFYLLFLLTPLILYPKTSEIFEFNKIVFVYLMTSILSGLWLIRMIMEKRIIFKRTILDIPLLIFLSSQILSTIFSLDPRTSFFGYYSRFNGGLLSTFSYLTLYWAFVSNMDRASTKTSTKILFLSTIISSFWAIFEHFGHSFSCLIFPDFGTFDVSCWVQDVQNRVYSTFGQPNWLAAWLVALIPLTWSLGINSAVTNKDSDLKTRILAIFCWFSLFVIFFVTLIFTKSRSGLLAFGVEFVLFWLLVVFSTSKIKKTFSIGVKDQGVILVFLLTLLLVFSTVFVIGTPWTPSVSEITNKNIAVSPPPKATGPALETGGTESGKIREIVWKGAIDIWKHYAIFGSGVETFAYSYYQFRPVEHNLVSEWDYLYNKAHNEYLNFAATSGTVGLFSYLVVIAITLFLIYSKSLPKLKDFAPQDDKKNIRSTKTDLVILEVNYMSFAFIAGYISILITNFFGFSVVPISLLFFLFPAFVVGMDTVPEDQDSESSLNQTQKSLIGIVGLIIIWAISMVGKYWEADITYAQGNFQYDSGNYSESIRVLSELVQKVPKEPLYWDKLSNASAALAHSYSKEKGNENYVIQLSQAAISESSQAVILSPANVNFKRSLASNLISLSPVDSNYLTLAIKTLEDAIKQSPSDPKLFYNLSYAYLAAGDYGKAISKMQKAVELKSDYEKGRFALALMYEDTDKKDKAKENLRYILEHINPQNSEAQAELDKISN